MNNLKFPDNCRYFRNFIVVGTLRLPRRAISCEQSFRDLINYRTNPKFAAAICFLLTNKNKKIIYAVTYSLKRTTLTKAKQHEKQILKQTK